MSQLCQVWHCDGKYSIQLTRHQICGNMCCTAYDRYESTSSRIVIFIRSELDCGGAVDGEGAGDGGAEIVTITIGIITTRCRAAVALGG